MITDVPGHFRQVYPHKRTGNTKLLLMLLMFLFEEVFSLFWGDFFVIDIFVNIFVKVVSG